MLKSLFFASLLTLTSASRLYAAEAWPQFAQFQTFIKNLSPLKVPVDCCPEPGTERPIPETYADLFDTDFSLWCADPLVFTESISEYQYAYTLFQNAKMQAVVVHKSLDENSMRYHLFELWSFDLNKGLVGRLELSGDYLSVMLGNGHATYYDMTSRILANGQIERQLTRREEAGLNEEESPVNKKTVLKQRFQMDLSTGKIVLLE